MSLRRSALIASTSLLLVFQCCPHTCICDIEVSRSDGDDSENENDLLVEVEEDGEESEITVFQPTHEWKTVQKGEVLPAGLHIRMNLETGLREAKLMSGEEESDSSADGTPSMKEEEEIMSDENSLGTQDRYSERASGEDKSGAQDRDSERDAYSGFQFKGDQRRAHYYGHSDRRGIINKRRRAFSQREVAEMLKNREREMDAVDVSRPAEISYTHAHREAVGEKHGENMPDHFTGRVDRAERLIQQSLHPDLSQMMEHSRTLARQATIADLLHALEELEYYVHHIDNARDLNSIGGLVLVVRLLNHSHPDIRSGAAHVIGSATQSNPHVQEEVLDYGALELLCRFILSQEPELVQRRGLFALSALLRGRTEPQLVFLQQCGGLSQLGQDFSQRSTPIQLKAITLLTDLLREQHELLHDSTQLTSLLHQHIQNSGWCHHIPSLLHSNALLPTTEKALQAMSVLQNLCDFTRHTGRLQELSHQFRSSLEDGEDEVVQGLLTHSQELLNNIRQRNKEL